MQSDFGYHIIKLTGVRGGERQPFEQARGEIEAQLRKAQLAKRWPEAAEQFTNMAYEQPDSLQPLVDKFKLAKRSATVTRQPAPGASGALRRTSCSTPCSRPMPCATSATPTPSKSARTSWRRRTS